MKYIYIYKCHQDAKHNISILYKKSSAMPEVITIHCRIRYEQVDKSTTVASSIFYTYIMSPRYTNHLLLDVISIQ